jgi:ATP-dependent protease ClpP protease subunit
MINYIASFLKSSVVAMFCLIILSKCSPLLPKIASPFGTPTLSGTINGESASVFIDELDYALTKAQWFDKKTINVNISSFGGSVLAGHFIISKIKEIQGQGIKVNCFAQVAGSMAFAILQYCDLRIASTDSILMQHMIHNGNGRENMVIETREEANTLAFFDRLHAEDTAKRMGITYERYMQRYKYGKWYKQYQGCLDSVLDIVYDNKSGKWISCRSYKATYDTLRKYLEFYLVNPKGKKKDNAPKSRK